MVWIGSAKTSHFSFKSAASFSLLTTHFAKPFIVSWIACNEYPNANPKFLWDEESDKSLCIRDLGSLLDKATQILFDISIFASLFSKRIGLTLWGIVLLPTSPFTGICLKYSIEMYSHISTSKSTNTLLKWRIPSRIWQV